VAKAVFITKINPSYDDLPEAQYHFPHRYLSTAKKTVGDWIIYYEPRRSTSEDSSKGGRQAYFATARVKEIIEDTKTEGHYYALIDSYMEFPNPVPFREDGQYYENTLLKTDGSINKGIFRWAVRLLSEHDYLNILSRAYLELATDENKDILNKTMIAEPEANFERTTVERIVTVKVREAAFQSVIRKAYDATCALTGLKIINGGGLCEIEAAHIRPVQDFGPDSPRNGIALSRTCHWLFDRGIISLEDDGKILMAKKLVPDQVKRMINQNGYAVFPENKIWKPHQNFLKYHRENKFKG